MSARAVRDEQLTVGIQRVFTENYGIYGARKAWRAYSTEIETGLLRGEKLYVERFLNRFPHQRSATS